MENYYENLLMFVLREFYYQDGNVDEHHEILSYLANLNSERRWELQKYAAEELLSNNICPYCNKQLEIRTIKEHHTELDENPIEEIHIPYCPECGRDYDYEV